MKTTGTDAKLLSDADLRTCIGSAALDVYEAILQGFDDYAVSFAVGTLDALRDELDRRVAATKLLAAGGFTAQPRFPNYR